LARVINFLARIIKRVCPTASHFTWRELNEDTNVNITKVALIVGGLLAVLSGCAAPVPGYTNGNPAEHWPYIKLELHT
jgi:hypothetical protein